MSYERAKYEFPIDVVDQHFKANAPTGIYLLCGKWHLAVHDSIAEIALWPVLGFIFLPFTLLWYTAVQNWWDGHWGVGQIIGLVIALMMDIGPSRARKKRAQAEHRDPSRDDLGREIG